MFLCGQTNSIFRLLRLFRSGSESAALSYISRFILLFPYVTSSRGSMSVTSAGDAEVTVPPRGIPSPSTTTIHFEPLPRFVLPTSGPLFFAEAKLSSENTSSQFNNDFRSNCLKNFRHAFNQESLSSQYCNLRQHVLGDG